MYLLDNSVCYVAQSRRQQEACTGSGVGWIISWYILTWTSSYAQWLFGKAQLYRRLRRPNLAGIAFSGTVGMGLFVTSGALIGISGSAGNVIAFTCAGLMIITVMRSLAELVSVRPLSGALIDYPHTFVDPALGFAVGVMYWFIPTKNFPNVTGLYVGAAMMLLSLFVRSDKFFVLLAALASFDHHMSVLATMSHSRNEKENKAP